MLTFDIVTILFIFLHSHPRLSPPNGLFIYDTYDTIHMHGCTYTSKSAFICTFCKMINEQEISRKTITTLEIINFELISKLSAISFTGSMILFCLRIIIRIVINLHKKNQNGKFVVQTHTHTHKHRVQS